MDAEALYRMLTPILQGKKPSRNRLKFGGWG